MNLQLYIGEWKNLNSDYIGLVYYRRYIGLKKVKEKTDRVLTSEQAQALREKYEIIFPQRRKYYIESL